MAEGRFFGRLWSGLQKTRQALTESLGAVFSRKRIDAETLEELEEALILADLGAQTTEKILQEVTKRVKQKTIEAGAGLQAGVIETVRDILLAATPASATDMPARPRPWVLLMVGVNGVGKTTTLGKLAHQFQVAGEKSLLVAADPFRAAAIEQASCGRNGPAWISLKDSREAMPQPWLLTRCVPHAPVRWSGCSLTPQGACIRRFT